MALIETCWCAETVGLDVEGTALSENEGRNLFLDRLIPAIEALGHETECAQGQRILHHGWNGAHFAHRGIGWGTFDSLTKEEEAAIDAVADAAWYAAEAELDSMRAEFANAE